MRVRIYLTNVQDLFFTVVYWDKSMDIVLIYNNFSYLPSGEYTKQIPLTAVIYYHYFEGNVVSTRRK